jgi:hypothetical protein
MQVSAATPIREHEKPMSWARAVLIATGFFFITAILIGQLPSYFYTTSTLSTLARWEQGTLDLALLAIGIGLLCFEISFLYDPKPLIPWPLFALVGAGLAAIGTYIDWQVFIGISGINPITKQPGWREFLPDAFQSNGQLTYWPNPSQNYLFHPAWFQVGSIDLSAIGMIAIVIGIGMLGFAVLNPLVLSGRLLGPLRDLLVRFSMGLALVILALYLTIYTFWPTVFQPDAASDSEQGPFGNVMLFGAMCLALFALQVWLLPVMTANRQRFMPAVYLHGVVGLIGAVGLPLLLIWLLTYPVVNLVHGVDTTQFWVLCSKKSAIPESCTFTPFTGYIIAAIVASLTLGLLFAGLFFWSTRRDTIVLGGTIGLIYLALAVTVIHLDDPVQKPLGLIIATSIIVLAFAWTWGTQREFAPTSPQQLGCVGQWLVLGTLLLVYLFGFAVFSLPNFFEIEALALFYKPGRGGLHDAFWALLLMGGLAALQFTLLVRRKPMSDLRKFAMWTMLLAILFEMIGNIQGFHNDILVQGIDGIEGSHAWFLLGIAFSIIGIGAALYGALRARGLRSPWPIMIGVVALLGLAVIFVAYNLDPPYPELVQAGFIAAMAGALAYSVAGPDADELVPEGANGAAESSFVVTR